MKRTLIAILFLLGIFFPRYAGSAPVCEVYECDVAWKVTGGGYMGPATTNIPVVITNSDTGAVIASPTPDALTGNYCWRNLLSQYVNTSFPGVSRSHEWKPIGPTVCPTTTSTPALTATPTATRTATPTVTVTPTPTVTATKTPTPTPTVTVTPTATVTPTPTVTSTPSGSCADYITHNPTLNAKIGVLESDTSTSPPTNQKRQRVSNGSTLDICQLKLCLGRRQTGNTNSGNIHVEVWSDTTSSCPGGASSCPLAKLGSDSDDIPVGSMAYMKDSPDDTCGAGTDNGQMVTVSWAGSRPNPTGNFWIIVLNNTTGGFAYSGAAEAQIRWGLVNSATSYSDTNYDIWNLNTDLNQDAAFIVRTQ